VIANRQLADLHGSLSATQPSGRYHLSYFVGYLGRIIRFWHEECASGQAFFGHLYVPRSNDDFYRRPSSANIQKALGPGSPLS
jgi:hypothetical protein